MQKGKKVIHEYSDEYVACASVMGKREGIRRNWRKYFGWEGTLLDSSPMYDFEPRVVSLFMPFLSF